MIEFDCEWARPGFRLRLQLSLPAGVHGVYGPSGSGKTTLVNLLAGIDRPARGRICVGGRVLVDASRRDWVPPHKRRFATVFQEPALFPHMSVRRNLAYGQPNADRTQARSDLERTAECLEITDLLDRRPRTLSGGQARRVMIGRAMLAASDLIILDEPFNGLDVPLTLRLLDHLRELFRASGKSAIIVSHDLPALQSLTDRLVILGRGGLVDCGGFDDLMERGRALPTLREGGAVNVLRGVVEDHDELRGLTWVRVSRPSATTRTVERIAVPFCAAWRPGTRIVAGLRPQDIVVARASLEAISTQNHFHTEVTDAIHLPDRVLCRVETLGGLWVELTRSAVQEIGIYPTTSLWCLFKSSAVLPLSGTTARQDEPPTTADHSRTSDNSLTKNRRTHGDLSHAAHASCNDTAGDDQ